LRLWPQHAQEIDLLLTDMVMPEGISGWELAGKLRTEKPDLKVICTSGYSVDLAKMNFDAPKGMRFLQKPFKPQSLALAVRECLDRSEEHTSELQSLAYIVCRLLLEKKKK